MADNVDFCEDFTDLYNFLSMDAGHTTVQCATMSGCVASVDEETLPTLIPTTQKSVHPTTTTPDHSYSTIITKPPKRKSDEEICFEDDISESILDESLVVVKRSKYLERRKKNNIASKRSRETRKCKFVEMDEQSLKLEKANVELRKRIEELESLTRRMKEALVEKLSVAR
jgi:hypothetical protein